VLTITVRDVQDGTAVAVPHVVAGGLGAVEGPVEIEVVDGFPAGLGDVLERRHELATGVVYLDVEPSNSATVTSTNASTACLSRTSHYTARASTRWSASLIPSATGSTCACAREQIAMLAPTAASRSAVVRPMPWEAAATMARWPRR